jgi:hypothetical protein
MTQNGVTNNPPKVLPIEINNSRFGAQQIKPQTSTASRITQSKHDVI